MFITNPAQFAPPPPRRLVPVGDVPGLMATDGSHAKLTARELNAGEHTDYLASLRDDTGATTKKSTADAAFHFLARTICDAKGNLIWQDDKACADMLKRYPQSVVERLMGAANKANAMDAEALDRAEKNSEATPNGSSSGICASSSESLTPVS